MSDEAVNDESMTNDEYSEGMSDEYSDEMSDEYSDEMSDE